MNVSWATDRIVEAMVIIWIDAKRLKASKEQKQKKNSARLHKYTLSVCSVRMNRAKFTIKTTALDGMEWEPLNLCVRYWCRKTAVISCHAWYKDAL